MVDPDPIQAQYAGLRRSQILDAAAAVFADKGFHNATIKDVAKAAGVADGTIYNYFDNKDALILGILDRLNQSPERQSHFEEGSQTDVAAWGQAYFKQRFETLGQGGFQLFQVVLAELLSNTELRKLYVDQVIEPTYGMAEKYFDEWMRNGKIRQLDPALAVRATSGMFLGLLVLRIIGDPVLQEHWDELVDVATDIILKGIEGNQNE